MNKLLNVLTVPLLGTLLVACSEPLDLTVKAPLVETFKLEVIDTKNLQNLPAVVKASNFTELSFRVSGELISVDVKSGEHVKKGQLLAKLDPTNFQLAVNDRKSKAQLAKKSMERARTLVNRGHMAQSILDELSAKYQVLKAEYEYAKLQLSYVELTAPFSGIISSVPVDNFQNTAVGQSVITMHSNDMVEIQVSIPDVILSVAYENKDKSDAVFDVSLDAYPEHIFKAKYKEHTTEQTSENKKYVLILEMPMDRKRVTLEGMPGSIKLDLAKLKMKKLPLYKIPIEAIVLPDDISNDTDERIVWRLKADQTVEPVTVKAHNLSRLSLVDVTGDLKAGDEVITKGLSYLVKGMVVETTEKGALAK